MEIAKQVQARLFPQKLPSLRTLEFKLTTQLRAGLDKAPFVFSNSESVACADFDLTTRADLFEKRKQQHIERGYRIEDERPIPVNGLCSFIAVSERPDSDLMSERVQLALDGKQRAHCTV